MTPPQSPADGPEGITDLAEFLAHAYAMEVEAAERYTLFAEQMEVHNNPDVAALFHRLAEIEGRHAEEIKGRAGDIELPEIALGAHRWADAEGPETAAFDDAHYLMSPYHVLRMALLGEERAFRFFDGIAKTAASAEIRNLAAEYADEECGHVQEVQKLLANYTEPDEGWADDHDPPATPE